MARKHAVFDETGIVKAPKGWSALEAATLSCAAVTAWNALYGLRPLKAGDSVLVQGTGGVSLFALQVGSRMLKLMGKEIMLMEDL